MKNIIITDIFNFSLFEKFFEKIKFYSSIKVEKTNIILVKKYLISYPQNIIFIIENEENFKNLFNINKNFNNKIAVYKNELNLNLNDIIFFINYKKFLKNENKLDYSIYKLKIE